MSKIYNLFFTNASNICCFVGSFSDLSSASHVSNFLNMYFSNFDFSCKFFLVEGSVREG